MSQYAQIADLENYVAAAALQGMSSTVLNAALTSASDKADGYLRAQFTLPLSSWSTDLTEAVCHIAAFNVMAQRGFKPGSTMDEVFVERKSDAIRWLEQVASQKVTPGVVDSSSGAAAGVTTATGPKVLSRPSRGWDRNPPTPGGTPSSGTIW